MTTIESLEQEFKKFSDITTSPVNQKIRNTISVV